MQGDSQGIKRPTLYKTTQIHKALYVVVHCVNNQAVTRVWEIEEQVGTSKVSTGIGVL